MNYLIVWLIVLVVIDIVLMCTRIRVVKRVDETLKGVDIEEVIDFLKHKEKQEVKRKLSIIHAYKMGFDDCDSNDLTVIEMGFDVKILEVEALVDSILDDTAINQETL